MLVFQLTVLQQQQQRLEHGNGEQAVGEDRQQDMRKDAGFFVDQRHGTGGRELGQQRGDRAQREQQHQQVFYRDAQAGQQRQGNDRNGDQAGGAEKVQAQAQRGDQLEEQGTALGDHREGAEQAEQAFVGFAALGQVRTLVEGRGYIKAGGDQVGDEAG
ncbi:hypothetical protein D3C81_1793360 [compost metagenome]